MTDRPTSVDRSGPMAQPMKTTEVTAAAPPNAIADGNRLGLPQVSNPRRPLLTGRNAAIAVGGVAGAVVAAATAAAFVTGNENLYNSAPASTAPITQEGQTPTAYASLETQTGDPTLEIQNMLKADVNEYYNGTISLENPTFTAVDPDHPNNQQTVGLSQVEELCGTSIPQDSHIDSMELTNALIASNKNDGTMTILMDGIVGGKRVILKVAWGPQTVKTVKQGLFVDTTIKDFVDGEPVVSDEHGRPQNGNQLAVDIIDDQPATAGQ